jgi:hypothetical protein
MDERTLHLLVLDGSYSMNVKVREQSNWDRAVAQAKELCLQGNEGDGFLLLFAGTTPRMVLAEPHSESASVIKALDALESTEGSVSFAEVLAVAADLLDQTLREHPEYAKARVTIWSDGQTLSWPLTSSLLVSPMKRLAEVATLDVRDLASENTINFGWSNFAYHLDYQPDARYQPDVRARDRRGTLTGRLTNHSDKQGTGIQVRLLEQDIVRDSKRVSLSPYQSIDIEFSPILSDGEHPLTIEVAGDQLSTDNRRHLIVRARERYRVAVVGEKGHTQLLGAALEPNPRRISSSGLQVVEHEVSSFLNDQVAWDAIVFCDLDRLGRRLMERIESEVQQGHPLIVWLGPRANPNDYGRWIKSYPKSSPPASFRSIAEEPAEESVYALDPLDYVHPILNDFAGHPDAGLITAPIFRFWQLEALRTGSEVVISTKSGEPIILVHRNRNRGPLLLVAVPPYLQGDQQSSWSGLPAWPGFPPLVHGLLKWGLNAHQQEAIMVGEPHQGLLPLAEKSGFFPFSDGETERMIAVNVDPAEGSLDRVRPEEILALTANVVPIARTSSTKPLLVPSANWYRYAVAGMILALILETLTLCVRFEAPARLFRIPPT